MSCGFSAVSVLTFCPYSGRGALGPSISWRRNDDPGPETWGGAGEGGGRCACSGLRGAPEEFGKSLERRQVSPLTTRGADPGLKYAGVVAVSESLGHVQDFRDGASASVIIGGKKKMFLS